jgi:hypothetical protein
MADVTDQRIRFGSEHPNYRSGKTRDGNGYVILSSKEWGTNQGRREHRVVMEQHLGRPLTSDEVVHHINGDKSDNRIENLSIQSRASHMREHGKGRELTCLVCGEPRWYQPAQIARLRTDYRCRNCRFGRTWDNSRRTS